MTRHAAARGRRGEVVSTVARQAILLRRERRVSVLCFDRVTLAAIEGRDHVVVNFVAIFAGHLRVRDDRRYFSTRVLVTSQTRVGSLVWIGTKAVAGNAIGHRVRVVYVPCTRRVCCAQALASLVDVDEGMANLRAVLMT